MSITDELRSWAEGDALRAGMSLRTARDQALAIADRIDAEHEHELTMAHGEAVNKTLEVMGDGYIALPKDADGEVIHVGDVMEWVRYEDDDPTIVREVSAIGYGVFFAWSSEQGRFAQYEAHAYRHHNAPTVEDVLREFSDKVCDSGHQWGLDAADTIAEYAERIREVVEHE